MDNINEAILELEGLDEYRNKKWDVYQFNELGVPRVSHILAACRNSEHLIKWAASVGYKKYNDIREKALEVGSITHEKIDNYLIHLLVDHSKDPDLFHPNQSYIPDKWNMEIDTAYENFKLWLSKIDAKGYPIQKLIGLEIPVTCPYYGGTIDAIVQINNAIYIVDFKTSKQISPEYIMQTASYMNIINSGYAKDLPHINGIGIIRVDKSKYNSHEDLFLNEFIPEENNMIHRYQECFNSYVEAFYRTCNTNYLYDEYTKKYSLDYVLRSNCNE